MLCGQSSRSRFWPYSVTVRIVRTPHQRFYPHLFNQLGADGVGNRAPDLAPQGVYPCKGDDCWIAISITDDDAWLQFRNALDNPGWAGGAVLDSTEGRLANHDALDMAISAWTAERTEDEVTDLLRESGIAVGRPQRSRDLLVDPQYAHRGFYRHLEHGEKKRFASLYVAGLILLLAVALFLIDRAGLHPWFAAALSINRRTAL